MKRPNLRRVKKSADAMLGSLSDTRVMKADFKANLKTVKKEEEKVTLQLTLELVYSRHQEPIRLFQLRCAVSEETGYFRNQVISLKARRWWNVGI